MGIEDNIRLASSAANVHERTHDGPDSRPSIAQHHLELPRSSRPRPRGMRRRRCRARHRT
eukprot:scaffold21153_cov116-Isochrysis_galbana.AAC.7